MPGHRPSGLDVCRGAGVALPKDGVRSVVRARTPAHLLDGFAVCLAAPRAWRVGRLLTFAQGTLGLAMSSQGRFLSLPQSLSVFFQHQPLCPGAVASANKWVTAAIT